MTYRQTMTVKDNTLVIKLPFGFKDKKVVVTVDDMDVAQNEKMSMMRQAAKDPLYLADLNDVSEDFNNIDHESL